MPSPDSWTMRNGQHGAIQTLLPSACLLRPARRLDGWLTVNGLQSESRAHTTRHGTMATMETAGIGKRLPPRDFSPEAERRINEEAERLNVSPEMILCAEQVRTNVPAEVVAAVESGNDDP